MAGRLPDFIGIGTQKGGTTTFHRLLDTHTQLYLPECKEVHYFDLNYDKEEKWYRNHFHSSREEQLCGEITPLYMFHPATAKRIHNAIPNCKLITLLRDPVERTISHLGHSIQRGFEDLSPWEALAKEEQRLNSGNIISFQKHSYVERSKYIKQLERFEKLFRKEQMLILKSEDLFTRPKIEWEKVQSFLGINQIKLWKQLPRENIRKTPKIEKEDDIRKILREKLKETSAEVKNKYKIEWEWE